MLITIIILLIFLPFFRINKLIENEFGIHQNEKVSKSIKEHVVLRCKFSLFSPEYALVSNRKFILKNGQIERDTIAFYNAKRDSIFSHKWNLEFRGMTTIKNSQFADLVKKVNENCLKFKSNSNESDELKWEYRSAKTEAEKLAENNSRANRIRSSIKKLKNEKIQELIEKFEYNPDFTNKELLIWLESNDFKNFNPQTQ